MAQKVLSIAANWASEQELQFWTRTEQEQELWMKSIFHCQILRKLFWHTLHFLCKLWMRSKPDRSRRWKRNNINYMFWISNSLRSKFHHKSRITIWVSLILKFWKVLLLNLLKGFISRKNDLYKILNFWIKFRDGAKSSKFGWVSFNSYVGIPALWTEEYYCFIMTLTYITIAFIKSSES